MIADMVERILEKHLMPSEWSKLNGNWRLRRIRCKKCAGRIDGHLGGFCKRCKGLTVLGRAMWHLRKREEDTYEILLERYRMVERPDRVCSLCHNHMAQASAPWCEYCDDLAHESI